MQYFNIQVASQLSGVASATIRAWEKRYNAVVPDRGENKHRLYSEKDIEKLALLYRLTEVGQSIGKIAHLDLEELKNVYTTLLHRPYDERQFMTPVHEKADFEKILTNLKLALSTYKVDIISHELEKAIHATTPQELCHQIIVPLFNQVGEMVSRKELSITQEHTISSLVSFYLGQMIGKHYQKTTVHEELILIATPEGEDHQIGILSAALLCMHYGWKFIYLGASLPYESIAETANALKAHAVLLGTTRFELSPTMNVEQYVQGLQLHLSGSTEVWVGGVMEEYLRQALLRRKIPFFSNFQSFDDFLRQHD